MEKGEKEGGGEEKGILMKNGLFIQEFSDEISTEYERQNFQEHKSTVHLQKLREKRVPGDRLAPAPIG